MADSGERGKGLGTDIDQDLGWPLGSLELRILRAVWQRGRASVRDIVADITPDHRVAYTTVMTVMGRLSDKGVLHRELVGKSYLYRATLTPEEFTAAISGRMLDSLVAAFGELAIAQFAAQIERVAPDRLRRLRAATEGRETG